MTADRAYDGEHGERPETSGQPEDHEPHGSGTDRTGGADGDRPGGGAAVPGWDGPPGAGRAQEADDGRTADNGLLLYGVTFMSGEGVSAGESLYVPAELVDRLIGTGRWRPGALNSVDVYPPRWQWPPRWQHLKD